MSRSRAARRPELNENARRGLRTARVEARIVRPEAGTRSAPEPLPRAETKLLPPPAAPVVRHGGGGKRGLDWFSFFVANLQTGFGPFVSVYLTSEKWTQVDIGLVLTVGGLIGLFGQIPGGALVDVTRSKRRIAAISVVLVGVSALGLALSPIFPVILAAWVLHAAASCTLSPAIASLSLGMVGHDRLSKRLGRNARYASVGNAAAAAGMGAIGYYVSHQAVFLVAAALVAPALMALMRIPAVLAVDELRLATPSAAGPNAGPEPEPPKASLRSFLSDRVLVILAACAALFHLANGAMLPLLGSALTVRSSEAAPLLIAACIIVPQVVVAAFSPWVGAKAESWGRRPLLLVGFAALVLRGLALGFATDPYVLVAAQLLDGVSGAILGIVILSAAADVTRGTGRFALAQGLIGTGMGIGAALSTTIGGFMADSFGTGMAFLGLSGFAVFGLLIAVIFLPETVHLRQSRSHGAELDRN